MADRSVATTDTVETFRTTFNNLASDLGDISNLDIPGGATDLVEAVNVAANASATFVIGDDSSTEATITTGHTLRLKSASRIVIKTYKGDETGKFGRILGDVWCDGVSINKLMCKQGHAVEYYGQNKKLVEAAHLKNRKKHGNI